MSYKNMQTMEDFNSMKVEIERLRRRLDAQELVNDRMLRNAVERSTDFSRRFLKVETLILIPFALFSIGCMCIRWSLPWWFMLFTALFLGGCLVADIFINRITNVDFGQRPLVEIEECLLRQKRMRARRVIIGMICLIPWLICLCGLIDNSTELLSEHKDFPEGLTISVAIGAIVGAIIGIVIYFRMQRANVDALRKLRAFKE